MGTDDHGDRLSGINAYEEDRNHDDSVICAGRHGLCPGKHMDEAVPSASVEVTPESVQETVAGSVYETGRQQTVCIFTDSGNNGTGFVYQQQFVITNEHVLYEASGFVMRDYNGREYQGTVIFSDRDDDIAVIRVEDMDRTSAAFGDSDAVSAGDELICIGNPAEGEPFSTVSGTVLNLDDELRQKADRRHRFIASDAPVIYG
ncbi:MAG: trypsin-like peptidase domain-containing protein [Solobacterium sp.]|nr:trypsin-like peptidase domain-containing protein [Solobacterium sp.]